MSISIAPPSMVTTSEPAPSRRAPLSVPRRRSTCSTRARPTSSSWRPSPCAPPSARRATEDDAAKRSTTGEPAEQLRPMKAERGRPAAYETRRPGRPRQVVPPPVHRSFMVRIASNPEGASEVTVHIQPTEQIAADMFAGRFRFSDAVLDIVSELLAEIAREEGGEP